MTKFTPQQLGLPEKFKSFRPIQYEAMEHDLTSKTRFVVQGLPAGSGKSAYAAAIHAIRGGRTVLLTSSLGLEKQYLADKFDGMVGIRGRSNYLCAEGGNCEDGARLGCMDKIGCPASIAFNVQNQSELVVSNYAWWLATQANGRKIRVPDTLILDESGVSDQWLSKSLDFQFTEKELSEMRIPLSPMPGEEHDTWHKLASEIKRYADTAMTQLKAACAGAYGAKRDRLIHKLRHAESLFDRADRIGMTTGNDNWVISLEEGSDIGRIWKFECIWPGMYKDRLFCGAKHVILMGAVLRPMTMRLLGVPASEYDFKEWPRQFSWLNSPVYYIPTANMTAKATAEDKAAWLKRTGEILDWGKDRNGIIHTVSFKRAKELRDEFGTRHKLIFNGAADPDNARATEAFESFKNASMGTTLISPSMSTGWDFKAKIAEWQLICKIAFPDPRSKINQARAEQFPGYGNHVAAQELVQACGRIIRNFGDRGTTIISDDAWKWFKRLAKDFMPKSFEVVTVSKLPEPLEKL